MATRLLSPTHDRPRAARTGPQVRLALYALVLTPTGKAHHAHPDTLRTICGAPIGRPTWLVLLAPVFRRGCRRCRQLTRPTSR